MKRLRRLATAAGRLPPRGVAAARRRPRTAAGLAFLATALAIVAVALVLMRPAASVGQSQTPVFTVRDGWTLAELERHIEAGDIDAITSSPASGSGGAGELIARTRSGQVVTIDLAVGPAEAVSALTSLGYGNLMTTEAVGLVNAAGSGAGPEPHRPDAALPPAPAHGRHRLAHDAPGDRGRARWQLEVHHDPAAGPGNREPGGGRRQRTPAGRPDHARRRRGLRRGEARADRDDRVPPVPGALPPPRCPDPARHHALRTTRDGQDDARPRRRCRGGRPLPLRVGLGVRREVRRRRRAADPRPVRPGSEARAAA